MARESLRAKLIGRDVDGEEIAWRTMSILQCARGLSDLERRDLLQVHFLACYHSATAENERFDSACRYLEILGARSPYKNREEIVTHYCGRKPAVAAEGGAA